MGHLLLSLREGAHVDGASVTVGTVRLRFGQAGAPTLARLAGGGVDPGEVDGVVTTLRRAGLLDHVRDLGPDGSIRVQPLHAGFALRTSAAPARAPVGRHTFARFRDGALVLENAAAGVRAVIAGRATAMAGAILTGGAAPRAIVDELWAARLLGDDAAPAWEFHDLLLHSRARMGRSDRPYGATWPRRTPEPPARVPARGDTLPLPAVGPAPATAYFDVLEARRSRRAFAPPTVAQLAALLHHANGIHADGSRPYPSGGAVQELELYAAVGRCDELAPGLYRHLPDAHALEHRAGDVASLLADAAAAAATPEPPPVLLVITARIARVSVKYESIAYALVLKHVGVLQQTLCLTAEALGLAACPLGGGNTETFARAAGVDPLAEPSVGEVALGAHPPTEGPLS